MRHAPYSTFSDSVSISGLDAAPKAGRAAVLVMLMRVIGWPGRVAAARRDMAMLGAMSDGQLKDIGLMRQDIQDAANLPLGQEPGSLLTRRADEHRRGALRRRM